MPTLPARCSSFKESSHWDSLGRAVEGFSLGFVRAERSAFDWGEAEERIRCVCARVGVVFCGCVGEEGLSV